MRDRARYEHLNKALRLLQSAANQTTGEITSFQAVLYQGGMGEHALQQAVNDLRELGHLEGRPHSKHAKIRLDIRPLTLVQYEAFASQQASANALRRSQRTQKVQDWLRAKGASRASSQWLISVGTPIAVRLTPRTAPKEDDDTGVSFTVESLHQQPIPSNLQALLLPDGNLGASKLYELWEDSKAIKHS